MRHIRRALLFVVVLAITAPARPAHAIGETPPRAPDGGITGLDVMTSTVFQQGQSSFSGVAARLRVRSAALMRNVEFLPGIEYWQNSSKVSAFDIKTTRRDATIGGEARWVFTREKWQPYAGLGLGIHFLEESVHAPTLLPGDSKHSSVKGAVSALLGAQFGIGEKLGSFVELKFHDAVDYRQVKFNTGLSWNY